MNLAGILEAALKGKHLRILQDVDEGRQIGELTVDSVDVRGNGSIVLHGGGSYVKFRPSSIIRFEEVKPEPEKPEPEKPKGKAPKKND